MATLITKDLSRLGRNYIEVGQYTELIFPRLEVRYIAINDNFDSLYSEGNELAPFKNLFNEWYARDTSKKIRAVVKAKAERGERVGTVVPYGYKRDPERKGHLLVNDETAPIVRMIFSLCAKGTGPRNIANILRDKQILKPTAYRYQTEGLYGTRTDTEIPYGWKWYRVENTHEAIIDQTTWELAQAVRQGKRRRTAMGGSDKYSGLLYCADCNSKLYFIRGTTLKPDAYGFICSRYRKHMGEAQCTPHSIRVKVLDEIILEEIRKVTYYARAQTREFVSFINQKSSTENRRELNAKMVELASLEKRNNELNALFRRLYEDNVLGKVTNEQFRMLSDGYNTEQREITERLPIVKQEIENLKAAATNVERFVDIANKYTDLKELTPEVLRTFIERIIIHERTAKHSKSASQQIDICFRYIGKLAPEEVA